MRYICLHLSELLMILVVTVGVGNRSVKTYDKVTKVIQEKNMGCPTRAIKPPPVISKGVLISFYFERIPFER